MFKIGLFPHGPTIPTQVIIGNQKWATFNLNVDAYRDFTPIPYASSQAEWTTYNSSNIGCYASVNFDSSNDALYGKLYNGWAIKNLSNLAPNGYHIPTNGEWLELNAYLAANTLHGGDLKEEGALPSPGARWNSPNTLATNSTGFTAVGTGRITGATIGTCVFQDFGNLTNFAIYDQETIDMGLIQLDSPTANFGYFPTGNAIFAGVTVRCLSNVGLVPGQQFGGGYYIQDDGSEAKVIYPSISYTNDTWVCDGVITDANNTDDGISNITGIQNNHSSCSIAVFNTYNNTMIFRFKDWYVPAVNELLQALNTGLFGDTTLSYWTSTEDGNDPLYSAFKVYYNGSAWVMASDLKINVNEYLLFRRHTL
jgi:uncharacterized protein (TIGR02145 family)